MHLCIFPVLRVLVGQDDFRAVGVVVLAGMHNATAASGSITNTDHHPPLDAI